MCVVNATVWKPARIQLWSVTVKRIVNGLVTTTVSIPLHQQRQVVDISPSGTLIHSLPPMRGTVGETL